METKASRSMQLVAPMAASGSDAIAPVKAAIEVEQDPSDRHLQPRLVLRNAGERYPHVTSVTASPPLPGASGGMCLYQGSQRFPKVACENLTKGEDSTVRLELPTIPYATVCA